MPQLIAMIIVIVGALIYMFQTFGGTGDRIEAIAQKTSAIAEIYSIKDGIKLAARSRDITTGTGSSVIYLKHLAELGYFPSQINEEIKNANGTDVEGKDEIYYAISFGGHENQGDPVMKIQLAKKVDKVPGIFVDFSGSSNAAFFESQISNDLNNVAYIDRYANSNTVGTAGDKSLDDKDENADDAYFPNESADDGDDDKDGKFIIYFKDFGKNEVIESL